MVRLVTNSLVILQTLPYSQKLVCLQNAKASLLSLCRGVPPGSAHAGRPARLVPRALPSPGPGPTRRGCVLFEGRGLSEDHCAGLGRSTGTVSRASMSTDMDLLKRKV